MLKKTNEEKFLDILREELIIARGCTEPIAISYACAKAKEVLGEFPEKCIVQCSGNIIKNVKSVTIPNTGGQVGIEAAAVAGLVVGDSSKNMDILSAVTPNDLQKIEKHLVQKTVRVKTLKSDAPLHLKVTVFFKNEYALVEIKHTHTNIIKIEKNEETLFSASDEEHKYLGVYTDRSILSVDKIFEFANTVRLELVKDLLDRQIDCNTAIAEEGIKGIYGVGFGKVLLGTKKDHGIDTFIKAYTAAASEARMSGCNLPVVTNSGSGNQGIATSIPVIFYARAMNSSAESLYRALVFSNLLTIHQKTLIGRLSAFCGVVSASCSSGAAITFLAGGTLEQIKMTISNTLANTSGIICDGAKPSCGAKIASTFDAAYCAHLLAMSSRVYNAGDGIIKEDIEKTISSVGKVAREGMRETDHCILNIMLDL